MRRLPLPAALAHRTWSRVGWPGADRSLGEFDVVHGTNYVVPPSSRPAARVGVRLLVPAPPARCATATSRRAGKVLMRAIGTEPSPTPARRRHRRRAPRAVARPPGSRWCTSPRSHCAPPPATCSDPRARRPRLRARRRHHRASQEPAAPGRCVRHGSRRRAPELRLVIAGGDGDDRAAVDRGHRRSRRPPSRHRVLLTGYVDDAPGRGCSTTPPCWRTRRSTRASVSRCSTRCRRACRSSPRASGRSPRSPAPPRCSSPLDVDALAEQLLVACVVERRPHPARRRRTASAGRFSWADDGRAMVPPVPTPADEERDR